MSEVCENHGRIRCGECAYIEELKERLAEQELEIERLRSTCNDLKMTLENISNMDYDASQGHTHMLYDVQMFARQALQSIKGGESNDPQTSS